MGADLEKLLMGLENEVESLQSLECLWLTDQADTQTNRQVRDQFRLLPASPPSADLICRILERIVGRAALWLQPWYGLVETGLELGFRSRRTSSGQRPQDALS